MLQHMKSYKQLDYLMKKRKYDFIHCHTPIAGAIARLVAHKNNIKVIYTAHGFHFFKGAPIQNWVLYYPIEKFLAKYTDILITINKEDYCRAKTFKAKKVEYIPGVGVDIEKFKNCKVDVDKKKEELGIPKDAKILLSVGELSKRKNHEVVIKALSLIKNKNLVYIIAGSGGLKEQYIKLSKKLELDHQIILLGNRTDIPELCKISDIFIHPSIREGLGIAPLEAMASGLPLISSNVNGIKDYAKNGITGYCIKPNDVHGLASAIIKLITSPELSEKYSHNNSKECVKFGINNTSNIMKYIYNNLKGEIRSIE